MRIITSPLAFGLISAALLAPAASAAQYESYLYFGLTPGEPVGIGNLSFTGEAPGDGVYSAASLADLQLSFQFHPLFTELGSFDQDDLVNALGSVSIQLIGTTFQFTGPGTGDFDASAEFLNETGDFLVFSPSGPPQYLFAVFSEGIPASESTPPDIFGVYGAITAPIPEPSSAALLAGAGALGLVGLRRRRR